MGEYKTSLLRQIADFAPLTSEHIVDTIYFGGGTPTVLPSDFICEILDIIKSNYTVSPTIECTIEANPSSFSREYFTQIRTAGVNRISFGAQSFCDDELSLLGRTHTTQDIINSITTARKCGYENISLDLIYGIPNQILDSLLHSISRAAKLGVQHISLYGLKVEDSTPLAKMNLCLPDEELEETMYLASVEKLQEAGFMQYEISNFSRPTFESRHNLKYWHGNEYIGFGPAAYSYFDKKRYGCTRNIKEYIVTKNFADLSTSIYRDFEEITEHETIREQLIFGLRLTNGIKLQDFSLEQADLEKYIIAEFATYEQGRVRLTPRGMLLSNAIINEILDILEQKWT